MFFTHIGEKRQSKQNDRRNGRKNKEQDDLRTAGQKSRGRQQPEERIIRLSLRDDLGWVCRNFRALGSDKYREADDHQQEQTIGNDILPETIGDKWHPVLVDHLLVLFDVRFFAYLDSGLWVFIDTLKEDESKMQTDESENGPWQDKNVKSKESR